MRLRHGEPDHLGQPVGHAVRHRPPHRFGHRQPEADRIHLDVREARPLGHTHRGADGSGWHNLTLTTTNQSGKDASAVLFYTGAGPASQDAPDAFSTQQVVLQAYDEQSGAWQNVNDSAGHSAGRRAGGHPDRTARPAAS
ncbi:hypothetical protein QMK19_39705 [Streptomyces sp. H10-C2]|uniref:hypothetical protein n=1 Tax=unclassified Streptomyces TaxID=2593676 RepID=UPI0024B89C29|nr:MULTISPECIES: hypothetical protein [unclassified Streptomyces]MDJ0346515.1 hypothetical protein [Streptomyces sp. PH10-H1]MDJ0375551.1 hypothetical protein [Streptomyces sp. H10-C2]